MVIISMAEFREDIKLSWTIETKKLAASDLLFITLSSPTQVPLLSLYCHERARVYIGKILQTKAVFVTCLTKVATARM